jgi:putative ABC transport system permease protein
MFLAFTILAVLIAGLGLFGIASFTAEQRTREIGIRKVLGASVSGITFLLTKNFVRLVLLAAAAACPAGWIIMHKWLQNFAYKTHIGLPVFGISVFLAVALALLAVAWQTLKAASSDPVISLRYE